MSVRNAKSAAQTQHLSEADDQLLTRLKALRLELARTRNVPAYVVFSDNTLIEMASEKPATLGALSEINGVGPKKLEDYGKTFVAAINEANA